MTPRSVRPPVCADDRWYPSDASRLGQLVDELLAGAQSQPVEGELVGLIAPHAGYAFSGQTAAYAYRQLETRAYERVVVIGPSHYEDWGPEAMNASDAYATPLGELPIDAEAVKELDRRVDLHFVRQDREHSLEMQLPFLQRQLGSFMLLPIMMSHPFYVFGLAARNACEELSTSLSSILDDKTLLVASSDLSHLHDYEAVAYFDHVLQNTIEEYNIGGLVDFMVNEGEPRACGDMAIVTLLLAAKARGANHVQVLYRTNSGDVTGNRTPGQYTVGYMAAAVYRTETTESSTS